MAMMTFHLVSFISCILYSSYIHTKHKHVLSIYNTFKNKMYSTWEDL